MLAALQQLERPVPQRSQLDKQRIDWPVRVGCHDPYKICAELVQRMRADVGLLGELPETGRFGSGHRHLPLYCQIFQRRATQPQWFSHSDSSDCDARREIGGPEEPLSAFPEHLLQHPAGGWMRKAIEV